MVDQPEEAKPPKGRRNKAAYESAGPEQLARQPAKATPKPYTPAQEWLQLRSHLENRLNMLRAWRFSWAEHWQLLEAYILPRRGIFINTAMPTPNTMVRGLPINQNIVDPTGTYAMRRCAAGLMSGLMSPSRQWFKLKPALFPREEVQADAMIWFEEVEDRMTNIMSRSNFYDGGAQMFEDLVTFGTGPMIIYEDETDIIRCYTPCCGEYLLGSGPAFRVETFYRQFVLTVSQLVEMFELENCPISVQQLWRTKGSALEKEFLVSHAIEPNFPIASRSGGADFGVIPGDFTWREVYWLWGQSDNYPLSKRGFIDQPFIAPRWAVTSNDPYGRSVGMDVLPDIMQLQVESTRKAEGIEKNVRPPMLASVELKSEPLSNLPGRVTFVNQLSADKGMRPIYTVLPPVKEIMEDLKEIQQRIKEGFFNDLFMMLETAANKNMTAYEVAQRTQEKLQVIGPVIERLQNEALGPAIKRIFSIMERKGLLPPMPASLQGVALGIEYVGMIALAQRASAASSLEQFASIMGNLQSGDPTVADYWDREEWTRELADDLSVSKRVVNSPEKVAALRQARAQQAQQQQQAQNAQALVQGAQGLSQTSLAPDNALGAIAGALGGSKQAAE